MRSLFLVCVLCASAGAEPARNGKSADKQSAKSADVAYADQLTEAGLRAMKQGDEALAIATFEKANALVPNIVFVWNIAKSQRLLAIALHDSDPRAAADHRDKARARFREVLAANPTKELYDRDPQIEPDIRHWLAELDQQAAEEDAARTREEERKRQEAIAGERARAAAEAREQARRDALEHAELERTKQEREHALRLRVGVMAGIGLVGVGTGVVSGLVARSDSHQLSTSTTFDSKVYDRGQTANDVMKISFIAGGAVLVGSAVTYVWLHHRIGVLAVPTAHGGDVSVQGRF